MVRRGNSQLFASASEMDQEMFLPPPSDMLAPEEGSDLSHMLLLLADFGTCQFPDSPSKIFSTDYHFLPFSFLSNYVFMFSLR